MHRVKNKHLKDCFGQYLAFSGHFVLWSGAWCHLCWGHELDQKWSSHWALQRLLLRTTSHVVSHDLGSLRFGTWGGRTWISTYGICTGIHLSTWAFGDWERRHGWILPGISGGEMLDGCGACVFVSFLLRTTEPVDCFECATGHIWQKPWQSKKELPSPRCRSRISCTD